MNCNQARTMLSVYRELKNGTVDTAELDAHLETCAGCREVLASYTRVSEQFRSAAVFTPPADTHAKLMKALADEQLKFLQKSAPGKVSTPVFLKPYLQERAQETQEEDDIAAFSTAETGPLPIIHARRKRRKIPVSQFAVLGLAASILILLMMGGLTSLLMLARTNPTSIAKNSVSLARQAEVDQKTYAIDTSYPNVTSAIPGGNFIYYAASGSSENSNTWMVMQFDRSTQLSKPLLATPSTEPLIVLAASDTWLIWLQYEQPQLIAHGNAPAPSGHYAPERSWSLNYLSLLPQQQSTPSSTSQTTSSTSNDQQTSATSDAGQSDSSQNTQTESDVPATVLLAQGVFNGVTAPDWVSSPIQGTWLMGNTLLVAQIDQQGVSRLMSYALGETASAAQGVEIAKAEPGHILTWPTADSSGLQIYWADEWMSTADGILHSNIWEQQALEQTTRDHGYPYIQSAYTQKELLSDGMSFQPQVVDDTLFFMSTSEMIVSGSGTTQKPNGTPLPVTSTDTSVTFTPRTDQNIYPAPADSSEHGTIFMIQLTGLNVGSETMLGTVGQSTGLQAGNGYVIWQDNTGYRMYDVNRQAEITLGDTLNDAELLIINGNTTLWLSGNETDGASGGKLTLMVYNWPG